jgi:hypothetical protein
MMLTQNEIESELRYAYLHAIASKAGMSCRVSGRHEDNAGCDAHVTFSGETQHPYIRNVQIDLQLKATMKAPGNYPEHHSYFIQGKKRYEKLTKPHSTIDIFLVVLFLPDDASDWLKCSADELVLKRAAYWVNLYGAGPSDNDSGQTVYLPKANLLNPEALIQLAQWSVMKQIPPYQKP